MQVAQLCRIQGILFSFREWLTAARRPGSPVLRRLTRLEYNNTIRDLLGLDTDVLMFSERLPFDKTYFDAAAGKLPNQIRVTAREYGARYPVFLPAASLPADSRAEHGFSNRGDAQNFTAVQLEQYVQLAEQIAMHPELLTKSRRLQEIFPAARFQQPTREAPAQKQTPIVTASGQLVTNDNVTLEAEGNPMSLSMFRERLQQAFQEDRGGVYDVSHNANSVIAGKGAVLQLAYGQNANRVIELNPSEDIWNAAFATVDESSGGALFTNKVKGKKSFFFGIVARSTAFSGRQQQHGDGQERPSYEQPMAGVVEVGVVVLSRKDQQGDVVLTVDFANDESQSRRIKLSAGAGVSNTFVNFQSPEGQRITRLHVDGSAFSGDYVLLDDLALITNDSPSTPDSLVGVEPPAEEAATVPVARQNEPQLDLSIAKKAPRERLAHFMQLAFRRPVEDAEVDLYEQLYTTEFEQSHADETAMRRAIHGVLSSPQFLYVNLPVDRPFKAVNRSQPTQGTEKAQEPSQVKETSGRQMAQARQTDAARQTARQTAWKGRATVDQQLASQLSYSLWSSMPDDELRRLADTGQLRDAAVLEAQTRRMLKDPRVRELSENFFVEWLRLRELWSAQPDAELFRDFYEGPKGKRTLAPEMFCEALLLFETILVEDRSILELLHSDETWLNGRLAKLYGIDEVTTDDQTWQRTKLNDAERGGVLTMGATLTLTSFPTRTSPIKRGVWLLETVFNRPPSPPTIAVTDIDAQQFDKGLTIREKTKLHRENDACAVCHNRIDPPGFALEGFDGIGRLRERDGDKLIDDSGQIAGAGSFDGPAEFKQQLLRQKERFVRGFTEQMLSYGLARKLEYFDAATVDEIVQQAAQDDFRLSRIVVEIVKRMSETL
ncbi:MAG: DUF1592 domain-containing protein [Planctomycetaceae bacterium]